MGAARRGLVGVAGILVIAASGLGGHPSTVAAELDTNCNVDSLTDLVGDGDDRVAETFAVGVSGTLTSVTFEPQQTPASTTVPYVARISHVDGSGAPLNDVLATASSLPNSTARPKKFTLSPPLRVRTGERYAAVLTRPGGAVNTLVAALATGSACTGSLFESIGQTGPWSADTDHLFLQTEITPDPSIIHLRKKPKRKTSSTKARFKFDVTNPPREGAYYDCLLDRKVVRNYCASPIVYKGLKPGPHVLRIRVFGTGNSSGVHGTVKYRWKIEK
jgi:hypothetical protein